MSSVPNFDTAKFHLGKLCPAGHDWNGTRKSLKKKPSYSCVECSKLVTKKNREKNRDKRLAYSKEYRATENNKKAQQKYWSKPENLEKRRQYNASYRQRPDYPEMHRRGNAKYGKTEKGRQVRCRALKKFYQTEKGKALAREVVKRRRATEKQVHATIFTEEQRLQRMSEFDNCCAYCGKPATAVDHFIPISKGGSHVLGNLIPACKPCNSQKFNLDAYTWYSKQPFFSKTRWKKILTVLGKTDSTINQLPLF